MTEQISRNATDVLHRKLEHAGGVGVPIDRLSSTEQHTLSTLVRQGRASISFGIAYRVLA